jgi:hypothetical protein
MLEKYPGTTPEPFCVFQKFPIEGGDGEKYNLPVNPESVSPDGVGGGVLNPLFVIPVGEEDGA